MNKIVIPALVACVSVVLLTGCASVMSGTNGGTAAFLFSSVDGAVQHGAPVGETASTERMGSAASTGVIFVAFGDSSVKKAMENGGITKIHHVDYKFVNVFGGLFVKYNTVVYGE